MEFSQCIKGSHCCYDERSGHECGHLIVGVLNPGPWIQQISTETGDTKRAIGFDLVTHRMLHKSICDQNEVTGQPAPERNRRSSQKMISWTKSLFAPDKRADERTFKKEREHAFHCEGLSDDATSILGKFRPVRSELKLHGNAGDDSDCEIDSENLGPEANGSVVLFIARPQGLPLPIHQEPCQAHSELRKEVVIGQREAKLQPAPKRRIVEIRVHCLISFIAIVTPVSPNSEMNRPAKPRFFRR